MGNSTNSGTLEVAIKVSYAIWIKGEGKAVDSR